MAASIYPEKKGMKIYKKNFSFTIPSANSSSTTVTVPQGATIVGMQKTEPGNRPPATRIEMSGSNGNTATITYSNAFNYSYNAAGTILYTYDKWEALTE